MKHITIYRNLIHQKQLLADESGTTDYLGAMIAELYPKQQTIGLKLPSQLKRLIFPFTIEIRRSILDSPTTISILQSTSFPQKDAEAAIIEIMAKFQYQIIFQ